MRLNIVKSKNAEQLYIIKSIRKDGKSTTRIMKKLGTMASLLPKFDFDRDRVIAWAKNEASILTDLENEGKVSVDVSFNELNQLDMGQRLCFNIGYLFVDFLFYELGLDKICNDISKIYKFEYSLADVLRMLIATRIIEPSSKLSSYDYAFNFLEEPSFDLQHVYRSLDIISKHSDEIQALVYANSDGLIDRNKEVLFYDCTNYFFEIDNPRGFAQYGKSKEHRPNPIVQMGLFLDGNGLPLCFSIFDGNKNEQPSLKPLEKKILKDFGLSKFIVCTDAGLSSYENRKFNSISDRSFIVTQSLKTLKGFLLKWALDPNGWQRSGSKKIYNINDIDEEEYEDTIFFKQRWINENGLEQRLIVSYSIKQRDYQRSIRDKQVDRARKIISSPSKMKERNLNSPKRFIAETSITNDGEICDKKILKLNEDKISKEEMFDGFYAVCTNLEKDTEEIIKINKMRWQIESSFRTMKSEFKTRPVYLRNDNRIEAHFLTCFLSLLILKLIERKTKNKYTEEELLNTLKTMNVHKLRDLGYLASYTRTEITDDLHQAFGFRTDKEFISEKSMKKY
ncbi:MAG: IS1634 family transposase [Anaerococcus sp.]|nr:IS1634 family transposase [Anaerococcus sp.]